MKKSNDTYVDLRGRAHALSALDKQERELLQLIRKHAEQHPDWLSSDFHNYWITEVGKLYGQRGISRREITKTTLWAIAQDIESRMAIASGHARAADYRDELEQIIRTRFRTRREFCAATGLSEDMLSHVFSKRKHMAIDTLTEALNRIGYTLHIAPLPTSNE